MQWSSEKNSGFTEGTPWIPLSKSTDITVESSLRDEDSVYYHYKKLISLRKEHDIIAYGNYRPILEENLKVFGYIRSYENKELIVLNNFYGETIDVDVKEFVDEYKTLDILISNYKDSTKDLKNIKLRPYESIAYIIEK
ncbi:Oligo-1,6-glucosidase [compost metagenome]